MWEQNRITRGWAMNLQSSYESRRGNFRFFSVLENEGGNGQKKFSVKNGRELFFKSEPDEKNEICWNKIWSLGAELRADKVRTNLARIARELLARGLSRTLNSRSFSHNDRILLRHILFFAPGPHLNKSFSQLFAQNFFWPFPPSFSETEKKIGNSLAEIRTNFARS